MTDILLIAGPEGHDAELVASAAAYQPHHVTVLIEADDPMWAHSDAPTAQARRDRLATLLTATALATGAGVVGMVGDSSQLQVQGFDAIVGSRTLLTAA
ncbi:hypothetical protein VSS74_05475 [Conexibacter stalactiti]|uniref:Uncharacterized protein n=1 Tax=Conexibacter stalactiti TaxID=1940611 RepID=A0ABU4HKD7_9ACTN|nr:hypothetical protein [Conexibacter stalactiti]MDW5593773.1 hypothetical protein [Conexibacter stalactiti]MEC5034415.1 hypothetical protein [Conexibacter stalactiti]